MENLKDIKSIDDLIVGQTYFEDSTKYYLARCLSVDSTVQNNGFNTYYQTATFYITTKKGREVETVTKKFFL